MTTIKLGPLRAEGTIGGLRARERSDPGFAYRKSCEEGVLWDVAVDVRRLPLSCITEVVMARTEVCREGDRLY